jgi:hypothetical protein
LGTHRAYNHVPFHVLSDGVVHVPLVRGVAREDRIRDVTNPDVASVNVAFGVSTQQGAGFVVGFLDAIECLQRVDVEVGLGEFGHVPEVHQTLAQRGATAQVEGVPCVHRSLQLDDTGGRP